MSSHKKSGFTLIELLVVVSIIGLLSSIILASVSQAKKKATAVSIVQEFIQVRNAIELYRAQHGVFPCQYGTNQGCPNEGTTMGEYDKFENVLFSSEPDPYFNDKIGLVGKGYFISSIYTPPSNAGYSFWYSTMIFDPGEFGNDTHDVTCGSVKVPLQGYLLILQLDNTNDIATRKMLDMTKLPHETYEGNIFTDQYCMSS
jgi:prepilin-type N-terminal cleavage/methylation domain-containing protein